MKTKPQGINAAFLLGGKVFATRDEGISSSEIALETGSASVAFEPVDGNSVPPALFQRATHYSLDDLNKTTVSEPYEASPGEVYACWLNHLNDWTLSGSQTIQLMIVDRNEPCIVRFLNEIELKTVRKGTEFRAWIATHRSDADLLITVEDLQTGKKVVETCGFDPACKGGQFESGYQDVRVPIPPRESRVRIGFAIKYKGYMDDGNGAEPFLFLADPRLSSSKGNRTAVLSPRMISDGKFSPESEWMAAPVPGLITPATAIDITCGKDAVNVPVGLDVKVELVENHGYTLVLSASRTGKAVLAVDGEPITRVTLTANTVIRLPAKCLNGAKRHVALKDESGSQILWETTTLLPRILTPAELIQRESSAPFAPTLFPQSAHRYASLKARLDIENTDFRQISHALSVLEGGYEKVTLDLLEFPEIEMPDVSVVIPAHNKIEVTYLALCSLLLAHNAASFEVIVVDDASTDETAKLETFVSGIRVIHNETPQRFIRSCNAGAEAARGRFIALLNNDVEVTSGWLDELIAAFDRFDNVGLAGAKLVYPNGELQDAGGIIWGNGNPWNYGNRQNPDEPRFSYARQADYLSGAALLIPSRVWTEVGGLSSYLEPMYFEDTDLAFKVREAGYSTWFVPASVIYHYEGMTSGTDVSTGFKKFQEVNRPKFKRRWSKAFANRGPEGENPDLEKDRGIVGRVLFIDYTTPRGNQDAGSYAAIQEIRLVQSLGYKVSFLPMNMAHFENGGAKVGHGSGGMSLLRAA